MYRFGFEAGQGSGVAAALRDCFGQAAYVNLEFDPGEEIDRLPFPDGAARTVLCAGVLEYSFRPQQAVEEMMRILAPGGALLVCAVNAHPVPDRMPAYWQLTPRSVQRLLAGMETTLVGWQGAETFPHTIYGVGFKPPIGPAVAQQTGRFLKRFQARLDEAAGRGGWRRLKSWLTGWTRSRLERQHRRDYYQVQFAVHLAAGRDFTADLLDGGLPEEKTGTRLDLTD